MQLQGPVTILSGEKEVAKEEVDDPTSASALKVRSTIEKIKVAKLALGIAKVPKPKFDLGADLKEVSRSGSELKLKYALYLDTFPAVQRVELYGLATVRSPIIKSYADDGEIDESLMSEVAVEIFRNNYSTIYLLFDSMGLSSPSPWLVKDVHLV